MGAGARSKAEIDSEIKQIQREIDGFNENLKFKRYQMKDMTSKYQRIQWKSDMEGIKKDIASLKSRLARLREEKRNAK